jgi:hypothetical protein
MCWQRQVLAWQLLLQQGCRQRLGRVGACWMLLPLLRQPAVIARGTTGSVCQTK